MNAEIYANIVASILLSETHGALNVNIKKWLLHLGCQSFTILNASGNICTVSLSHNGINEGIFDVYDLKHSGETYKNSYFDLNFFEKKYPVHSALYCVTRKTVRYIIVFHSEITNEVASYIKSIAPAIGEKDYTLNSHIRRLNIFADYQRKIDLMDNASSIFASVSYDESVLSCLRFYISSFLGDTGFAYSKNKFYGENLTNATILIDGISLIDIIKKDTEQNFYDSNITSSRFHINNILIEEEPVTNSKFVIFNVSKNSISDVNYVELITRISGTALNNAMYLEQLTDYRIKEVEMDQTVKILNQFIDFKMECKNESLDLYGINYPARSAGGDFAKVIDTENFTFFCVADVCGKGYSAAVFTVVLSTITDIYKNNENGNLKQLITDINEYLLNKDFEARFITGLFCLYDKKNRKLKYISCGHEPGIAANSRKELRYLTSQNLPLGIIAEDYKENILNINPKDSILLYTDGVTEYTDLTKLEKKLIASLNNSPENTVTSLFKELTVGSAKEIKDDFTCILVKFT